MIWTPTSHEGTEWSVGRRQKEGAESPSCCPGQAVSFFECDDRHSGYPMGSLLTVYVKS